MEECELTLLPKDQCGGTCCRPDLQEPREDEPVTLREFMENL